MSLSVEPDSERSAGRAAAGPCSSSTLMVAGLAAGLLAFYVVVYPLFGLRVTIGSDSPVYIWWARFGGNLGMGPLDTGARPGVVGLVATLSRVTPGTEAAVVAAVLPVLAVAIGLGAGALVDIALGHDRRRFALTAVFTGAFLSLLTDGYVSTLAFGSAFVAGLACLCAAAGGDRAVTGATAATADSERPGAAGAALVAGGVLVAAAGLSHPLFLALGGGVIAGGLIALVPGSMREAKAGTAPWRTAPARIAAASLAGAAAVALGLAGSGGLRGTPVETSRDFVLRRSGLGSLLRESYVRKLGHDWPWYRVVTVVGLAIIPAITAGSRRGGRPGAPLSERARFFWGTMVAWVAVAAGGVVLLLAGSAAPGQRLAAFCLGLPVLGAVGLIAMRPDSARASGRRWRAIVAVVSLLFLGLAWARWLGERPLVSPEVLDESRSVGLLLAERPPGSPLVVVMDSSSDKPTLFVTRDENYVRDAVAPSSIGGVHFFLGQASDFLAGRPTVTGNAEHDAYSRYSLGVAEALPRRPLVVLVRSFDPVSFRVGVAGGLRPAAPGVLVLSSPPLPPGPAGTASSGPDAAGPGPQSPWTPVWLGALLLAASAVAGWPWAALAVPRAGGLGVPALAPAFGLAAVSLASVMADGVGLRLAGAGGWVALIIALSGWLAWGASRVRGDG